MTLVGDRLSRVQYKGHLDLDALYAPLATAIHEAVLRRATPDTNGVLRLSLPARFAMLADIGRLLDDARPALVAAIMDAVTAAERAATMDAEPLPPESVLVLAQRRAEVAQSLHRNQGNVLKQAGVLLARGIAGRAPAATVAKWVSDYFSPWFAPRRDADGTVRRAGREGAIRHWPGRAGQASAHSRTVMLTETTTAHARTTERLVRRHNAALRSGERLPIGMKWNLSSAHQEADICSDHADRDTGWGRGVYEVQDHPPLPSHPNCRCFWSVVPLVRSDAYRPNAGNLIEIPRSESVPA